MTIDATFGAVAGGVSGLLSPEEPLPEEPLPEEPLPEEPLPEESLPEESLPEEPLPEEPLPEEPLPEEPLPEEPLPEEPLPEAPLPEAPLPEAPLPEAPLPEAPPADAPLPAEPFCRVPPLAVVVAFDFPPLDALLAPALFAGSSCLPTHDCESCPSLPPPPQADSAAAANVAAHSAFQNPFIALCFVVSDMIVLIPGCPCRPAPVRAVAPRLCR
jgi:hypothetical protein